MWMKGKFWKFNLFQDIPKLFSFVNSSQTSADARISRDMCKKMSGTGLVYAHLRCVFERDGEDGLTVLLTSKDNNKIRVSNHKDIIQNIINHVKTLTAPQVTVI